jgi:hypothetical protein
MKLLKFTFTNEAKWIAILNFGLPLLALLGLLVIGFLQLIARFSR